MKNFMLVLLSLSLFATGCYSSRIYSVTPPDSTDSNFEESLIEHNLLIRNPGFGVFSIDIGGGTVIPIVLPVPYEYVASGTYVLRGGVPYILTAAHVQDHFDVFQNSSDLICHIEAYGSDTECVGIDWGNAVLDEPNDVMLVPLTDFIISADPTDYRLNASLRYGQEIYITANPAGLPNMISRGIIRGFGIPASGTNYENYVFTDAAGVYGSSGGGVYDSDGILIGVYHGIKLVENPMSQLVICDGMSIFTLIRGNLTAYLN